VMFKTVQAAVEAGEKERARDLLSRLIKMNPNNAEYWLWMSAVVTSVKERVFCLKEAYRLDPNNSLVQRGLIMSGELPLDPKKVIPFNRQRHNWQSQPETRPASLLDKLLVAPAGLQVGLLLALILIVGGGLYFGISRMGGRMLALLQRAPTPTYGVLEVYPSATLGSPQPTPTFDGPTPLWVALERTYTPTPRYVDTPHPRTEDYRTAMSAMQRHDWPAALTYLQNAILLEPESPDLYFYIGEVQRYMENYESSLEAYQRSIALDPVFAPAHLGRALAWLGQDSSNANAARTDMLEALRLDPNYADAYRELAALDIAQGEANSALDYLDQALQLQPDSPMSFYLRGRAYLLLNELDLALEDAQHANQLDLTLLANYRLLGEIYMLQGNSAQALGPLQTYLLYEPGDEEAWVWLGEAYLDLGQPELAIQAYTQYLEKDPTSTAVLVGRGTLYLKQDLAELAQEDFKAALNLQPRSFEANMGLGEALMMLEEFGPAYMKFAFCEGIVETPQQEIRVYYWRARSLEALGEYSAAIRDWQKVLTYPDDVLPPEYKSYALQRLAILITSTFTVQPSLTATATTTRWPTQTVKPSSTRQPTNTVSSTRTPSLAPSRPRTPTP